MTDPLQTLAAITPDPVRAVCRTLSDAGFEAWAVGGAVRDAIIGRPIGDWDVATSAHPDQVQRLFRKTIPTGIQHGTVTVVIGRGAERMAIEVTTFRGEGAYSDARRPDAVEFGVPLDEDLARRDLVINAIAYDPVADRLHDPFDGQGDIAAGRIRAVGAAVERFTEDGLRVMRAIRFAAQLEFTLDPDTEAAIEPALPSLERVAVERVRDELQKMLKAPAPSLGFVIARRTGVLALVLPELGGDDSATFARVDAARAPTVREAALLLEVADADAVMRRLKASNQERREVVSLIRFARLWREAPDDPALRRALGEIGRDSFAAQAELWRADGGAAAEPLIDRARAVLDAGDAITIGELAVRGADLMRELDLEPGRQIGELLAHLFEQVLIDPSRNQPAILFALARDRLHV